MKRVMFLLVIAAIMFNAALFSNAYQTTQRRHANCMDKQALYDGQFVIARFLGHELGATEQRINEGLARLRVELGPRPHC